MVYLVEGVLVLAWLLFAITQLVLPIINGTRLFPLFRGRDAALDDALSRAEEQVQEAETATRIQERLDTAKRIRSNRRQSNHSKGRQ